ncbi:hypothetical protein L873DRAFT_1790253 [Choiromyces venosus 120613-1]|uniref:Uncharacterized protein n=1 Tax=Choiromyces venosus 120613-1 TaxID=1336337 RepID=A0A3N4JQP2_9PEZI|nr:hypothetical protein L873DRAFT_1790253 [Choiromyces venosus 120613-1]
MRQCPPVIMGDLTEAIEITKCAKKYITADEFYGRGKRLIDESVQCGVTAMGAFVEVDLIVGLKCVEAGLRLKEYGDEGSGVCDIQITVQPLQYIRPPNPPTPQNTEKPRLENSRAPTPSYYSLPLHPPLHLPTPRPNRYLQKDTIPIIIQRAVDLLLGGLFQCWSG